MKKLKIPNLRLFKDKTSKSKKHKSSSSKGKKSVNFVKNFTNKSVDISKRMRRTNIRKRLVISFVIILVIPILAISVFSSLYSKGIMGSKITNFSSQEIKQISKNIGSQLDEYKSGVLEITTNKQIQDSLAKFNSLNDQDKSDFLASLKSKVTDRYDKNKNVVSYAMLTADKQQVIGKNYDSSVLASSDAKSGQITMNLLKGSDGKYYINFFRGIISNSTLSNIGYLYLNLDENSLYDIYKDNIKSSDSSLFIINSKGMVISSKNKAEIGNKYSDNNLINTAIKDDGTGKIKIGSASYYISYSNIDSTDWHVVSLVPTSYVNNESLQVIRAIIIIAVIIFIIALLMSFAISYSISAPLNKLMKSIEKAKDGNFVVDSHDDSLDEIGLVNRSFNEMMNKMNSIIKNTKEKADNVLQSTNKISAVSQKSFKVSEEIASTMNEVAKGSSDQADGMTKCINYIGELSEGINHMEEGIEDSAKFIHQTNVMSEETKNSIAILKGKSQDTKTVTEGISRNVKELSSSMKEIEKITKVMVELSDHTNLLSLNAAIEAARAGEAGKGFTVVSEEVRKLADQSRSSSVKISNIIAELKEKVDRIVEKASNTSKIIKNQEEAIDETSIDIENIISAMSEVDSRVNTIVDDIASISELKEKTSAYIEDISAVSEETAAITEEVTATAQEQISDMETLAEAAQKLDSMVKKLDATMSMFVVE
ncbi:methyl-accepting chemotaxis protein [Clostridium sp. 19966]|uniref:methyl-accepting chemotaxis protein n=1 Tax=Clostridium sp. 19966 TaxID=2768166 RepID=UPI0028DF3FA2|nr:methyl-accepting chemotaxis protein [Clostridium sp. 19966]MDT8715659.1 methyl-accepting chemotaxis protein [Clostridium sp. 19966]